MIIIRLNKNKGEKEMGQYCYIHDTIHKVGNLKVKEGEI